MDVFDAATPGQSLTMQPGSMPMERPPQFTDPNQALEYIFTRLTRPEKVAELTAMLKSGLPVEYVTRAILFEGVIQGKWTVDVAMLIAQVVMWQIEAIARLKNVGTKLKNKNQKHLDFMANFIDLLSPTKAQTKPVSTGKLFSGL